MTARPNSMPVRPGRAAPGADLISDVLRAVRLDAAFFYKVVASEPWCVRSGDALARAAGILPHCEHLIAYHVLVQGHGWGGVPGSPLLEMHAGSILVFPAGGPQQMASAPDLKPPPGRVSLPRPERLPFELQLGGPGPRQAIFVCGFLGCDRRPFNPLLEALPRVLLVSGGAGSWIDIFSRQALEEADAHRPGGELVVARLAELMFIETLRRYLESLPPDERGWLAAARDELVGRALWLVHSRLAHAWTLAGLAAELGCSRSVLADRFSQLVGEPPMQYLTRWRMQVAAQHLAASTAKLGEIARHVGYDSEAAFSRAFKRIVGAAPAHWRATRAPRP